MITTEAMVSDMLEDNPPRCPAVAEQVLADEGSQRRRQQLDELDASAREAIDRAAEYLEDHRHLHEDGVITRIAVADSRQSYD